MKNQNERLRFALGPGTEYHANAENGSVTARVCPYGVPDDRKGVWRGTPYVATVYEPGCWTNWIETYGTGRTKFLFDHGDADMPDAMGVEHGENALPIGAVTSFDDRADGLYFNADFASAERAQSVRELASMGGLTDVSHGSNVRAAEVRSDGYRHVTEAQLWDVSVVVWGQFLEEARITEVRARKAEGMERNSMEVAPTIGSMVAGSVYGAVTGMLAEYLRCGIITVEELASIDVASITSAVSAAVPANVAGYEVSRYTYYSRENSAHAEGVPEIDASKPDAELAASPETGVSAEATESELLALQAENESRLRLAGYAEALP